MVKSLKRIAVTGGAGQIAYNLLFRIASGEMLGNDQPIALHILEVSDAMKMLEGVRMELEDCAFPLLKEIRIGDKPEDVFEGIHLALLVGAKPRGPGMERKDLLRDNGKIFIQQGKALNEVADRNVKVLVVGNPCNTNSLIACVNAPKIPKRNFYAMTMLDQNRASAALARKAGVEVEDVKNVTIWGNHSSTQVPDFVNASIQEKPVSQVIKEQAWLENDFVTFVQKRGAEIIAARGKSSAASAANAIIDTVKAFSNRTMRDEWYSLAIHSEGNPYGVDPNLIFSFPCRTNDQGEVEIVKDLSMNDFLTKKIRVSEDELKEERQLALE